MYHCVELTNEKIITKEKYITIHFKKQCALVYSILLKMIVFQKVARLHSSITKKQALKLNTIQNSCFKNYFKSLLM